MIDLHIDEAYSIASRGTKFKNWLSEKDRPYNDTHITSRDVHGHVYQIKNGSPTIVDTFEFDFAFNRVDSWNILIHSKDGTTKIVEMRSGGYNHMMDVYSDTQRGTTCVHQLPEVVRNRLFWLPGDLDMDKATKIAEKYYANKKRQAQ